MNFLLTANPWLQDVQHCYSEFLNNELSIILQYVWYALIKRQFQQQNLCHYKLNEMEVSSIQISRNHEFSCEKIKGLLRIQTKCAENKYLRPAV